MFVAGQSGGFTPLFVASQHGHIEVVRALVGAGAAVNQANVRGLKALLKGDPPLLLCPWFGRLVETPH